MHGRFPSAVKKKFRALELPSLYAHNNIIIAIYSTMHNPPQDPLSLRNSYKLYVLYGLARAINTAAPTKIREVMELILEERNSNEVETNAW